MNVLVLNETSDLGGAETMAIELANALIAGPGNKVTFVSAAGILTGRLDKNIMFFPIPRYSSWGFSKIFFELYRIIRRGCFDIIHSQGVTVGIIAGIVARICSPKTKIVITHHSAKFMRLPSKLASFLLDRFSDKLIAISKVKYDFFIENSFSKKKVVFIPNFVDQKYLLLQANQENVTKLRDRLGIASDEKIVLGVGRLFPSKRFDVFIRVLINCAQRAPNIKIFGIILGDGPEKASLKALVDQCECSNLRIKLLGFQNNVAAYLKISDVFLFTSEREVLPMSLIEASALGVPIVCSNITGNMDIVEEGVNGFLVNPIGMSYSDSVLRLLKDSALAKKFSFHGFQKVKNIYEKEKVVRDIMDLYSSLAINDVQTTKS